MAVPTSRPVFEHLDIVETSRRRRWTENEKLRIVAESLSAARQVSSTARRHSISRSLLTTWRRHFRVQPQPGGQAGPGLVPAAVLPEGPTTPYRLYVDPVRGRCVARPVDRRCQCRRVGPDTGAGSLAAATLGDDAQMIPVPSAVRLWVAVGHTSALRHVALPMIVPSA